MKLHTIFVENCLNLYFNVKSSVPFIQCVLNEELYF